MTLLSWLDAKWLKPHQPSKSEISELFGVVERSLRDSSADVSEDLRFAVAYEAALTLCTILLYASGFEPEHSLHHFRTLQALPLILGESHRADAEFLETARRKRNILMYRRAGAIRSADARELVDFVGVLNDDVRRWLQAEHQDLL